MFAVGHLALGYIIGKGSARFLKVNVNVPLLFFVSILPDIDFLVPGLMHRGPMHSIVVYAAIFVPVFLVYNRIGLVYFLGLAQHLVLGDFLTSGYGPGIQLLWPLSMDWFSAGIYAITLVTPLLEWFFFLICLVWMFSSGDLRRLLVPHRSNLALVVPILAIVLPVFFSVPLRVPLFLLAPHFFFLLLFGLSVLIDLRAYARRSTGFSSKR